MVNFPLNLLNDDRGQDIAECVRRRGRVLGTSRLSRGGRPVARPFSFPNHRKIVAQEHPKANKGNCVIWSSYEGHVGSLLFRANAELLRIERFRVVWSLREAMQARTKTEHERQRELERRARFFSVLDRAC